MRFAGFNERPCGTGEHLLVLDRRQPAPVGERSRRMQTRVVAPGRQCGERVVEHRAGVAPPRFEHREDDLRHTGLQVVARVREGGVVEDDVQAREIGGSRGMADVRLVARIQIGRRQVVSGPTRRSKWSAR